MTYAQMAEVMTMEEFHTWVAYYKLEAEELRDKMSEEKAIARAKRNYHR